VVAFGIVGLALNWFNDLSGKHVEIPISSPQFWIVSFGFVLGTTLLAGTYPALYLSSFSPMQVLKGRKARSGVALRRILVVLQFSVSTVLIIGTIMVYLQVQFAKDRPMGYARDGLIIVPITAPDFNGKYDELRNELKGTGAVVEMAESSSPPTDVWSANSGFDWEGKDPSSEPIFGTLTVTPEYGITVGWQFKDGRDFSRDLASDSAAFVINQAAAEEFGFDAPIGKQIRWKSWRSKYEKFTIIGVISNMVNRLAICRKQARDILSQQRHTSFYEH
ncbi:MAG: ABC transporter permease, partial [Bacteroidia bacterium]|nr:ABC transporter permease [Bacteroidia bacterium]